MKQLSSSVYILPANLFTRQEGTERKREACKSDEPICLLEAHVLNNRGFCSSNVCPGAAEPLTSSVRPGRRQAFPCGGFGTQRKVWMETWYVWNVWAFRSRQQQMFLMTWERAPWNYKQVCRVTGSVILEAVAGIKTTILKHRQPHRVQQSEQQQQQQKKENSQWCEVTRQWFENGRAWKCRQGQSKPAVLENANFMRANQHCRRKAAVWFVCRCLPDNQRLTMRKHLSCFCSARKNLSRAKEKESDEGGGVVNFHKDTRARTQNCEFVF